MRWTVDPDARDESDDHDGVNRSTTRGGAMGYRIAGAAPICLVGTLLIAFARRLRRPEARGD
jgi:hypothetical protein